MIDPADVGVLAYAIACVFGAAVVRGYSGFGFSLLVITALSILIPPRDIVPSIFMMEIAASLHLLPGVWREVHWRATGLLLAGCLVATPFGVWLLAHVPAAPMTFAIALFVLASAVLLARGFALSAMPGRFATAATGAAAGLCNGAFGMAGPPVILFFFSSPAGAAVGRASLIAFFIGTDTLGLGFQAREGLIGWDDATRAALFLPPLLAGIWLGARAFRGADPKRFRVWVLRLLMALAALTGAQAVAAML
ncbi:MAG: sulfite exporter TauE/SafE family protein [Alphaproteobacteria bacterium]